MKRRLISVLGGIVTTTSVVSLIIAILVVFKADSARDHELVNYLIASGYGAFFGLTMALGGFWMTTGRLRSNTQTLRSAAVIVVVICVGVIVWVYALIVADLNDMPHPMWASISLGGMVVLLISWAIRHQLRWGRRAQVAADAHPMSTLADLRAGSAFKLRGRVQVEGGLRGPVSGRPCALFNLDIIEGGHTDARLAGQLELGSTFVLRCVDGSLEVDASSFIAGYIRDASRSGPLDLSPRIAEAIGRSPQLPLNGRELSIGNGDIVDVVGIAERAGETWRLGPRESSPLIIVQRDPTTLGSVP